VIARDPRFKTPKPNMSLIIEKNLKVTIFSGKLEDWKFWEVKLHVRARHKGFREILFETVNITMDSKTSDFTKPAEKEKHEIFEKNELAFEGLALSIDTSEGYGRVVFQSVYCCKTNNYKNGNVADAWK